MRFITGDERVKSYDDLTYFQFKDGFDDNTRKEIERTKRETEAGERIRKDLEKLDRPQKD